MMKIKKFDKDEYLVYYEAGWFTSQKNLGYIKKKKGKWYFDADNYEQLSIWDLNRIQDFIEAIKNVESVK